MELTEKFCYKKRRISTHPDLKICVVSEILPKYSKDKDVCIDNESKNKL